MSMILLGMFFFNNKFVFFCLLLDSWFFCFFVFFYCVIGFTFMCYCFENRLRTIV